MDSYIFDLGFFESIIRDYAHGHLPEVPLTDTTFATLHFSPALALLAPLVLIWPSPLAVLTAQAVLVAVGVVPLMRAAVPGWMAWAVAVSYGLAPGVSALIGFDFHEVALAVPLLALQHGRDGARPAPRRGALGVAAGPGQGGPRAHRRRARVRGVPARLAAPGAVRDGRSGWSRSRCWRCGCRTPAGPAASPRASPRTAWATPGASSARGWHNKVAHRAVPAAADRPAGAALADAAARRAADLRLAVPLRPLHLLGPLVPVRRRAGADRRRRDDRGRRAAARRGSARSGWWRRSSARSCCCRSSTSRSSRSGTPTSGIRRLALPPSTRCSTRSRTAAGWRPPTTSAAGSRCAPTST